jgi:hypothetical protein
MSREMAQKVIVHKKKNYVPKFLKQRGIGNFMSFCNHVPSILSLYSFFFILIMICRENPAKYPSLAKNPPKCTTASII